MSVKEIYESSIRQLPAMERLRLASLILGDLTTSSGDAIDLSEDWSEQDMLELNAASQNYAARRAVALPYTHR